MEKKIPLLAIVGPTASGKTKLAVDLALQYNGEVVSADSMQIYRTMNIGTAKPDLLERQGIPHHLIDICEPGDSFSVANYKRAAEEAIEKIYRRGKLPILAGGTGLYIDAILNHIDFSEITSDPNIRKKLEERAAAEGKEALLEELKQVDPALGAKLHPNNLGRVMRALEVYYTTGIPMSEHQKNSRLIPSPYHSCIIGLNYSDRSLLYDRINRRVDMMLEQGLLEEAKLLRESSPSPTAYQAIGYKELEDYFNGLRTLTECTEHIKQESRRYAKRQLTWFRRNKEIHWIFPDLLPNYETVLLKAGNFLENSGIV